MTNTHSNDPRAAGNPLDRLVGGATTERVPGLTADPSVSHARQVGEGPAPVELTAWARGRLGEIIAAVQAAGLDPYAATGDLIAAPLGTTGEPGTRADRECDRCGVFVPIGTGLQMVALRAAPSLLVFGGLCDPCDKLEGGRS